MLNCGTVVQSKCYFSLKFQASSAFSILRINQEKTESNIGDGHSTRPPFVQIVPDHNLAWDKSNPLWRMSFVFLFLVTLLPFRCLENNVTVGSRKQSCDHETPFVSACMLEIRKLRACRLRGRNHDLFAGWYSWIIKDQSKSLFKRLGWSM